MTNEYGMALARVVRDRQWTFDADKLTDEELAAIVASVPVPTFEESEPISLLDNLVGALDGAFISTWQSTAAWQDQLDAARSYLENMKGGA